MADREKRREKQVSLASTAGVSKKAKKKKKKATAGTVIVRVLVAILVLLSLAFIGVMIFGVVSSLSSGGNKHNVTLNTYDTTPVAQERKVSYFLVGVTGENETSAMDMLTLVCYDKKAKTVQLLQVPTDTYIGTGGAWTVSRIGNVWNNPTPLVWCETCRKQVFEPERKDGKHTVCGTTLTEKTGSSVESLLSVFNDQYSMPVDNYFILSRETLVNMVNYAGGIDIELEKAMKIGDVSYAAGPVLLDGDKVLYYAHQYDYNGTPEKDLERLTRQRKVWAALIARLSAMDEDVLYDKVISTVMSGAAPIRANNDAASVAKMLAGIHSGSTDNVTFARALTELIGSLKKLDLENSAVYLLPGTVAKQGSATYYGVSRADALALLQSKFNPYGLEMKEEHLQIPEISSAKGQTDTKEQKLSALTVEQKNTVTTAAPTTAATTGA